MEIAHPMRWRPAKALLIACLATIGIPAFLGAAEEPGSDESPDRVILLVNEGSGRVTIAGRITDYTGKAISIVPRVGGSARDYDASLVVDVQTSQLPAHVEGMKLLRQREFAKARASFEDALNLEDRPWVRREILAMLIRCAQREGDTAAAIARFLVLVRSDPETRHWDLAPLAWSIGPSSPELRAAATGWKRQKTDASRLLAASYLLFDPAGEVDSLLELRELATQLSPNVSALARAQQWRKRLAEGNVTPDERRSWQSQLLQMRGPLRGGPSYVLGMAHRKVQDHNLAAACLLWVPATMPDDALLAAQAQRDAAQSLATVGQRAEARILFQEIVDRYAQTPAAADAAKALKSLDE